MLNCSFFGALCHLFTEGCVLILNVTSRGSEPVGRDGGAAQESRASVAAQTEKSQTASARAHEHTNAARHCRGT